MVELGDTMQRVFLYGTLKKDQPNHARMAAGLQSGDCVFEGIGETQTRYPLIVDPLFNIPFLLGAPNHPKALVSWGTYACNWFL